MPLGGDLENTSLVVTYYLLRRNILVVVSKFINSLSGQNLAPALQNIAYTNT